MKKIILTTVLLVLFSVASVSLAQDIEPEAPGLTVTLWGQGSILTKATNWFFGIVLTIAAIILIAAGFNYITAGGNEEKIRTAFNMVTSALIGVAIAVLAKGLVYLICNFVSQGTYQCTWF